MSASATECLFNNKLSGPTPVLWFLHTTKTQVGPLVFINVCHPGTPERSPVRALDWHVVH